MRESERYLSLMRGGALAVAASALLAFTGPAPAIAQDVNNAGWLVHASDDEAASLDPAQIEPGEAGDTVVLQVYDRLLDFVPG